MRLQLDLRVRCSHCNILQAGLTPLHVAAKNARPNIVRVLLRDRRVDRNPNDNVRTCARILLHTLL